MSPIKNTKKTFIGSIVSRIGISTTVYDSPSLVSVGATSSTIHVFSPGNGYTYHIFRQPGRFYVYNPGYIDYLVIGGGGGGGGGAGPGVPAGYGGGGGAGGYVEKYNILSPIGFYDICIGLGGNSTSSPPGAVNPTRNGYPSFIAGPIGFSQITANGGGHGGAGPAGPGPIGYGYPGGSGGGGAAPNGTFGSGLETGLKRQGYPGGWGGPSRSGGGGGASQSGQTANADASPGAPGGNGLPAFGGDTGIPPSYGTPGSPVPLNPGRWFAGGGGGVPQATGGVGGGGAGGQTNNDGSNAVRNTGGGGGGGGTATYRGGYGGSGIVIIRYKNKNITF
jgi:hypothetical protein